MYIFKLLEFIIIIIIHYHFNDYTPWQFEKNKIKCFLFFKKHIPKNNYIWWITAFF